jgi:hypothetical protein
MNRLLKTTKCLTVTLLFFLITYSLINPETSLQLISTTAYNNIAGVFTYTMNALVNIILNILTVIATTSVAILIPIIPFIILTISHPKEKNLITQYPVYFLTLMICNTGFSGLVTIFEIIESLLQKTTLTEATLLTISTMKNTWLYSFGLSMFLCCRQYSPTPKTKKAQTNTKDS